MRPMSRISARSLGDSCEEKIAYNITGTSTISPIVITASITSSIISSQYDDGVQKVATGICGGGSALHIERSDRSGVRYIDMLCLDEDTDNGCDDEESNAALWVAS